MKDVFLSEEESKVVTIESKPEKCPICGSEPVANYFVRRSGIQSTALRADGEKGNCIGRML